MNKSENRPTAEFDHNVAWKREQVAEGYDAKRFTSLSGRLYDRMEKRAIGKCLDFIEKNRQIKTALDIPCGTGRISEFLLSRGFQVTGSDISEAMMVVARKTLQHFDSDRINFCSNDIYDIADPDASYDCVTCIRLFQHLTSQERARALCELARVTQRYLIVNAMYTSPYYDFIRKLRKFVGRYAPRYTMSAKEMKRELAESNLRLVKSILTQPGYNGNIVLLLEKYPSS